ncbi:MAG: NAD-dependent epimerase/dehydratase family protein [Spirochaetales bacterium]|nr:NAD-dependent epimerase/dehydratase family protein [Leptospiraceae bacterium]MCP5481294.1 NAD-dependent epimerase/dehydratase family protein [Spirochaetales bacterium]MCP5485730.1 NAD-dependent epimerase/dehydratase family protein [Spirochaetales bacterium]
MNIFLTGATGFVGGAIARELKGKHRITALARSATSAQKLRDQGLATAKADLLSVKAEHLSGVDVVVHCAAFVGPWGTRQEFWQGNVEGTRRLLEAARVAGVKRFIHMGTEAALFRGQAMVEIDERYPYPKRTPYLYSETKREAEKLVLEANSASFETIVLRPRLVWGPGDTSVLPVLVQMVREGKFLWLNGGRALTSTAYIGNLVHAVELALTGGVPGQVYFITDDEKLTYRKFLTAMLETQNVTMPTKSIPGWIASFLAAMVEGFYRLFGLKSQPPLMRFATDAMAQECTIRIDRAKAELGYRPLTDVAGGLEAMRRQFARSVSNAGA